MWSSLLRSEIKKITPLHPRIRPRVFQWGASTLLLLLSAWNVAFAGSATWKLNPGSDDWNTATNWTPETVPNGPADTATFNVSDTTEVSISAPTEVASIVFNAGGSPFTITAEPLTLPATTFTISGVGITNNSGITQNVVAAGAVDDTAFSGGILFTNTATAGSLTAFTTNGGAVSGGFGGAVVFRHNSTAGDGTFTNNGAAVSGAEGGVTIFAGSSSAGSATLIANGGSNGGTGGAIVVDSIGGMAHVKVFGNGNLDISGAIRGGVNFASIEGSGNIFLGGNTLAVGHYTPDPDITFSGVIQDGGLQGGTGGSLIITHTAAVLSNANTYTGGTVIVGGKLLVNNRLGSGTGSGPVGFQGGYFDSTLGGTGTIAGAVAVPGNTFIHGFYFLSPGAGVRRPGGGGGTGTLTIQSTLTFDGFPGNGNVIYHFELNSRTARADKVVANGVTISGAEIAFGGLGGKPFTSGTVFTVIDNTAATPIAGTFTNLPDGFIFSANRNNFQASYEGGDGNDLTLTVVP